MYLKPQALRLTLLTFLNKPSVDGWLNNNCYFNSLFHTLSVAPDNVTDQDIEDELSSDRGHGATHLTSLIHETFQLESRTFVREHAYNKGEPNLTVQAFADWIDSTYQTKVHTETAHRWLGVLGFSQVHHQKGFISMDMTDRRCIVQERVSYKARRT